MMGNPTSSNSLGPLHKTLASLKEIKAALLPFLRILKDDDDKRKRKRPASSANQSSKKKRSRPNDDKNANDPSTAEALTPHRRAEAEAAVALAIGTLRYMGARLRGLDRGRKKGDPLRMELDKIRGMLVALRKLESDGGAAVGDDGKNGSSGKEKGKDGRDIKKSRNVDTTTNSNFGGKNSSQSGGKIEAQSEAREVLNKKQRR